jgi:hypothetical protein
MLVKDTATDLVVYVVQRGWNPQVIRITIESHHRAAVLWIMVPVFFLK